MTNIRTTSCISAYVLLSALCLTTYPIYSQNVPLNTSTGETLGKGPGPLAPLVETGNGNEPLHSLDHRVILHPGRWKIRTPKTRRTYVVYQFYLGSNWTELEVHYPECSQVACRGLPEYHQGCDHLCSTDTWLDATVALKTATLEYNKAMASLDAAFDDLAALMDTHITNHHSSLPKPVDRLLSYHGKGSASNPHVVDVMQPYRTLIEDALKNIVEHFPSTVSYTSLNEDPFTDTQLVSGFKETSTFNELLDTWRSRAFTLAVLLNGLTFALQGAQRRIIMCSQGVHRLDMTGCERDFIREFYTDIPVARRSLSSYKLVMVVKRESWNPVLLSHWYMPFIDSSNGNRTCWLDRPMVNDTHANYRVPRCDSRGICEPLEVDTETISACEVNEYGEISFECPVVCGNPCFGPICYQPQLGTYKLKTISPGSQGDGVRNDQSIVRVTKSPRILSKVYSLSEGDIHTSLASILNRSAQSSELLRQGKTMLQNIITMDATARKYIDKVYAEKAVQSQGPRCVDCERMIGHSRFMAAASVTLSILTCPLLIVVIINLKSGRVQQDAPVKIHRSIADDFL